MINNNNKNTIWLNDRSTFNNPKAVNNFNIDIIHQYGY